MERKLFNLLDSEASKPIPIEGVRDGQQSQWKCQCANCKSLDRTVSINDKLNLFHCYRCGWKGAIDNLDESKQSATDPHSIETDQNNLSLRPDHLVDLRKSGLSDETIREAGIFSVSPSDISKKLEGYFQNVKSFLAFPYPGSEGYERYKLFPPQQRERGTVKYYQKSGSPCRLYISSKVVAVLPDASIPIYFTEGEKKTLKAIQEGLFCIGLGGLWNWSDGSEEKNLIPDFDKIEWRGRTVYLVPDNDWLKPDRRGDTKNLKQAVHGLGYRLIDRGARVFIVYLPDGPEKGLDDYLCNHSAEEYRALRTEEVRKYSLDEMIESLTPRFYLDNQKELFERLSRLSEVERDLKFKTIAGKLKVSKTSVKNDFNPSVIKKGANVNVDELLEKCVEGCKVYTAQNYYDGVLSYGAVIGDNKLVVESTGNVIQPSTEVNMKFTRTKLTKEAIKRFRNGEDVNGKELHGRLSRLFSDHVIFPDPRIPDLLATWVIGTYVYISFPYYGYILLVSPTKRCAKSLVEDLLSHVCHNATPRSINPSEASVFRQVDRDDITLIVDEVESLSSKEKDKRSEMFSLLNGGFQKGSTVTRIESRGKEFVTSSFNSYSPKVLAGIKGVSDTLEDRSFKIPMVRIAPGEKVKRFNVRHQEDDLRQLRDDLYIFGLRHGPEVIELYDLITGKIPGMEGFDDRQKDILEPLACINLVIDELANDENRAIFNTLIELSRDMSQKRISHEKLEGDMTAMLKVLEKELDGTEQCFIPIPKLLEAVNATGEFSFKHTRGLGRYMAKLGIYSDQKKIEKENSRGYTVTKAWVEDQKRRYIS